MKKIDQVKKNHVCNVITLLFICLHCDVMKLLPGQTWFLYLFLYLHLLAGNNFGCLVVSQDFLSHLSNHPNFGVLGLAFSTFATFSYWALAAVWWLAEIALDLEVLGSSPVPSKTFFRVPADLKFVQDQSTQQKNG